MSAATLDGHLSSCPDCALWLDEATRLTRQARLSAVTMPDLAEAITRDVVLPVRRVLRRRLLLRAALLLVAVVQLAVAIPSIGGHGVGMVMSEHAAHETAAWNLAIGVAFFAAVLAPRRAAGLVPLLGTFIVALSALSIHDVAAGDVPADRLLTHVAAVVGLLLLLAIDRAERALPPGRFGRRTGSGSDSHAGDATPGEPRLRGVA